MRNQLQRAQQLILDIQDLVNTGEQAYDQIRLHDGDFVAVLDLLMKRGGLPPVHELHKRLRSLCPDIKGGGPRHVEIIHKAQVSRIAASFIKSRMEAVSSSAVMYLVNIFTQAMKSGREDTAKALAGEFGNLIKSELLRVTLDGELELLGNLDCARGQYTQDDPPNEEAKQRAVELITI